MHKSDELQLRTMRFAVRIVRLCRALQRNAEGRVIRNQLLRCGTSVAANYRAVCRARSKAEFVSKLSVVVEETDETLFWFQLLVEAEIVKRERLAELISEADELVRIFAAARRTTQLQVKNQKSEIRNSEKD